MLKSTRLRLCVVASVFLAVDPIVVSASPEKLADGLRPFLSVLSGEQKRFELNGSAEVIIDRKPQTISLRLIRFDDEQFDLDLTHQDYAVRIRRRTDLTAFELPKHGVVFVGHGMVSKSDCIQPQGIVKRLVSPASQAAAVVDLVIHATPDSLAQVLTTLLEVRFDAKSGRWSKGDTAWNFPAPGKLELAIAKSRVTLGISQSVPKPVSADAWPDSKVVAIDRAELERTLARGVRRAGEILAPSTALKNPAQSNRKVDNGELRWIGGQRVALLQGSPEEIGRAHGELLAVESRRCIDSVLYTFAIAQAIRTGRWFRHDLDLAYERLAPHIPERHKVETRAMARSLGIDPKVAESLNVFPELFHCSGFAVFGKATTDGKLYHGRVLDYMTTIGLQDSATTFIVKPDGKIPFANVGYAGFIGSVSGMNARQISLGEMGGRGEGKWDGVPMATLMRRALEECETLDEVMNLWKNNPRTCEYYYVFADGKTNRAVGVAAFPESVEFVFPGQADPRLGEGIVDAVVLSADARLKTLRERVQAKHGRIDVETAKWLMSRPVAMQSNLHKVLFVPADGVLYVANADHKRPAAERPYVRLDLNELIGTMTNARAADD
ncbi:MAG: C45 family autoproteolytic acyltransferase/hydrolase [Planctomycetota bacterium]|nr:C45 family autoproteolytic acyltransferase/hydrolase [Planctomycetota bacterium]